MNTQPDMFAELEYLCACGTRFPEECGRYGCPSCLGDQMAKLVVKVRARHDDPDTSQEAAALYGTDKARRSVEAVVKILERHGEMSDFRIAALWPTVWPEEKWSESLPRKARHWAREAGLVREAGYDMHDGRRVRTWILGRDVEWLQTRRTR